MQQKKNVDKNSKMSKKPIFLDDSNRIGGLQAKSSIGTVV